MGTTGSDGERRAGLLCADDVHEDTFHGIMNEDVKTGIIKQ